METLVSSSFVVDQPCLDPCPHVDRNWVVRHRSSAVPHSLLVVDSPCGHNWCLCFRQMEQSWRMWWTVCFASLQLQSAESMMPIRFRCSCTPQCPIHNLNIVFTLVSACTARGNKFDLQLLYQCGSISNLTKQMHP